jgi:hypothetical protein
MISLLLSTSILNTVSPVSAGVKVEMTTFQDWKEAVRISNGTVEVVVVPQIGRVMFFGYPGKPNFLWVNGALGPQDLNRPGYKNFGGDKTWWAPQSAWNWPPDRSFDGEPYSFELLKDGVRMSSKVGALKPLKVTREIRLSDVGTLVRFKNRLENTGARFQCALWQVTQVNDPAEVRMQIDPGKFYNQQMGSKLDPKYHQFGSGLLKIARHPKTSYKFGGLTVGGLLSAKTNGEWFVMKSDRIRRAVYPDNNSAQEVYTNPDPDKYVELEQLSPLITMDVREIVIQNVEWSIRSKP